MLYGFLKKKGWLLLKKEGFIDKAGIEVIPCIYDLVMNFSEGLAMVKINGSFGYIDKAGNQYWEDDN